MAIYGDRWRGDMSGKKRAGSGTCGSGRRHGRRRRSSCSSRRNRRALGVGYRRSCRMRSCNWAPLGWLDLRSALEQTPPATPEGQNQVDGGQSVTLPRSQYCTWRWEWGAERPGRETLELDRASRTPLPSQGLVIRRPAWPRRTPLDLEHNPVKLPSRSRRRWTWTADRAVEDLKSPQSLLTPLDRGRTGRSSSGRLRRQRRRPRWRPSSRRSRYDLQ